MAKIPTLKDLMLDPKRISELTTPQLQHILEQANTALKIYGQGKNEVHASPAEMAKHLSKGAWQSARHLETLNQWLVDLDTGKRKRVMVSMPPRHGKSELISYWYPIWLLAKNPKCKIVLASYEEQFATLWGRRVRRAMMEWGHLYGLELDGSSTAADNWSLVSGGGMFSTGAGGALTGRGAHVLIIDDPIKNAEDAASETMREKLWDWFQTTAFSRLEPGGYVVIVGTRWHEDDLIGRLERASRPDEHGNREGLEWDILKFPAIAEPDDPLGREIGEPLWPFRFDETALATIRKGYTAYNWSSLYQQNPTPEDGGGVKRKWWNYYEVAPADFDVVIQSWDLAFKDLKSSDFTVGQVWGRKGAQFFLLHTVRARMNAPDVILAIKNISKIYPRATAKLIEDKANGPAVIQTLQKDLFVGGGIIPVKVKGSKDARLQAVMPFIEAGNVYLPGRRRPDGTYEPMSNWVSDFIEESAAFPNGTYDDQVDAMTQAISYLQPQAWSAMSKAWKEAKDGTAAETTEELMNRHFAKSYSKVLKRVDEKFKQTQLGAAWKVNRTGRW